MKRATIVPCLAATLVAGVALASTSTEWPGFRGPSHDLTIEAGLLRPGQPVGLELAWKRALGSGYSGVSVAAGVAVTAFRSGDADWLAAFALDTGDELWRVRLDDAYVGHDGSHDGPISTPLVTHGKVIALAPRGRLVAVDLALGEERWSHDLTAEEFGARKPYYGFATSPIVVGDVLLVAYDVEEQASISGFDVDTGERLWSAGGDKVSYQSPLPLVLDDRPQVLTIADRTLYGVDPENGELLWEAEYDGDATNIGSQSTSATPAGHNRYLFANKQDEGSLIEFRLGEDGMKLETLWTTSYLNNTYTIPVFYDGVFYGFSNRFMVAIDAETGKTAWKSRQPGDGFLMLLDGHLVILTKLGSLHVARPSRERYDEVTAIELFEDNAWTAPAFADGHLYVRSFGEIARVAVSSAALEPAVTGGVEATGPTSPATHSRLADLLTAVEATEDKSAAVDRFFDSVERLPLVEGTTVHFLYRGEADDVAIVGDMFPGRHEEPMQRIPGTDVFYCSAELAPDAAVKYHFVRDFEEAVLDPHNPRSVEIVTVFRGTYSWLEMPEHRVPAYLAEPVEPRGRIETIELPIEGIEEEKLRTIEVYLPPGYEETEERYPVAYVHAGLTVKERGAWVAALDHQIGESLRPVIVAFIEPGGPPSTEAYVEAVSRQIVPAIDERFRTLATPESRANVGLGFEGMTAFASTFGAPGVFGKLAVQSPFLLSSAEDRLRSMTPNAEEMPLDVYLDWGAYDPFSIVENWNLIESSERTDALLRERGYDPVGGAFPTGFGFPGWNLRTGRLLESLFPLEP